MYPFIHPLTNPPQINRASLVMPSYLVVEDDFLTSALISSGGREEGREGGREGGRKGGRGGREGEGRERGREGEELDKTLGKINGIFAENLKDNYIIGYCFRFTVNTVTATKNADYQTVLSKTLLQ